MRRVGKVGIYPVPLAFVAIVYRAGLIWVMGRKWRWACPSCGRQLIRHSAISLIFRILFWVLLIWSLLAFAVMLFPPEG